MVLSDVMRGLSEGMAGNFGARACGGAGHEHGRERASKLPMTTSGDCAWCVRVRACASCVFEYVRAMHCRIVVKVGRPAALALALAAQEIFQIKCCYIIPCQVTGFDRKSRATAGFKVVDERGLQLDTPLYPGLDA